LLEGAKNIYELDIIYALPLLFAVAFPWQFLMHKVRLRMRQYYINEGYFFAVSHGGRAYMPLSESAFLQSYGVAPIG